MKWLINKRGNQLVIGMIIIFLTFNAYSLLFGQVENDYSTQYESENLLDVAFKVNDSAWILISILAFSLTLIIPNITNLIRARQYWVFEKIPSPDEYLIKYIGFERYLFWPKLLKALAVLALLFGLYGGVLGALGAYTIAERMSDESFTVAHVCRGMNYSAISRCITLMPAIMAMLFYYFFMGCLSVIKNKGQKKYLAIIKKKTEPDKSEEPK